MGMALSGNICSTTLSKMQISISLVNPQVRKQWLPGGPENCSAWNQYSEGKANSFLESISFLIKGFWNPGFFLGNQYNGKVTTCCLSDAGCNQRVDTHLFPSATAKYFKRF